MEQAGEQSDEQQQGRQDQETRRRILKAAERLFLEQGFKGTSMKDIAEEVHVTSAALYYHFPEGKQELFLHMVRMLFDEWHSTAVGIIAQTNNLEECLTRVAEHLMTSAQKYQSTFAELRRDIERYGNKTNGARHKMFPPPMQSLEQLMTGVFQRGIDAGEISGDVPAQVLAWIYSGAVLSTQVNRMRLDAENDNLETRTYVSLLIRTLLNGMRHPDRE